MKEKIIKNRKNILITLAFLLVLAFNIGMRYLVTRPRYKTLPEVRLVNQKEESTKGYAIMVPNESGDGYVEYTSEDGTWPSEEEGYEFKEAKCMDNNGQLVDNAVTFADGKVTLTTNKTIYCTMYFDEKPKGPLEITNVAVDTSGNQVTLTVSVKGGSGKYNYSVENSCSDICGYPYDSCGTISKTYNENIIIINNLSNYCIKHSFNVKVTDDKGGSANYETSISIGDGRGPGATTCTCHSI